MEKIIKLLFIAAIVIVPFAFSSTQKAAQSFEGIITYDMTSDNEQQNMMMLGNTLTIYFKGSKQKMIINGGPYITTTIYDTTRPEDLINMQEFMGHKFEVLRSDKEKEDAKKHLAETPHKPVPFTYTKETKPIAGYTCYKATARMMMSEDSGTATLYYTDKLFNFEGPFGDFKGLQGFPMQFTEPISPKANFIYTVKSVKRVALADSVFAVPAGYKKVSQQQLQTEMEKLEEGQK